MRDIDLPAKEETIERILRFILDREPQGFKNWSSWYVGITMDPNGRLYEEHGASIIESIAVPVESEEIARKVERFFIIYYGTDGNPVGGANPRFVYAFKKTDRTDPPTR